MDITDQLQEDDIILFSLLYSSVTVIFAMAILSKFLTNEIRFGLRSVISLVVLFLGEPFCHFLVKGPGGLILFSFGCLFVYSLLPASHLPAANKSVFITGCDSGFGHALVVELDKLGMNVFAGCLVSDGQGAMQLQNSCSERLKILQLDITNDKDIKKAVQHVSQTVGSNGLWGLVNNAGIFYAGDLEMTSDSIFQKIISVNLLGTIHMTNAMLPLIRAAKGRIVNVSSLAGRIPIECFGAYSMSKYAIVGFSNTLRLEMKKWGVQVSIIEPTAFQTGNLHVERLQKCMDEVWETMEEQQKAAYGREYLESIYSSLILTTPKFPIDLSPVVRAMRSGLLSKRPRQRYPCGGGAEFALSFYPLLPLWLADRFSQALCVLPRSAKPAALKS